jgi:hypothetical protein
MNSPDHKKLTRLYRFCLVMLTLGVIFWLGGSFVRAIIAHEFYIPGTVEYDTSLTLDEEFMLFSLIGSATLTVLISYAVVLTFAISAFVGFPYRRKDHGWLIMASVLFFLFVPVEIFTAYLDLKYLVLWDTSLEKFSALDVESILRYKTDMKELLSHRVSALSGVPIIAMLCYYTAVVMVIWQPMKRIRTAEEVVEVPEQVSESV